MPGSSLSDSSDDSDRGIRYKTDSIRNKKKFESASKNQLQNNRRHSSRKRRKELSSSDERERHKRKYKKEHRTKIGDSTKDIKRVTSSVDSSPSRTQIGFVLPPKLLEPKNSAEGMDVTDNLTNIAPEIETEKQTDIKDFHDSTFGPALPPHLLKQDSNRPLPKNETDLPAKSAFSTIGPVLPPGLRTNTSYNIPETSSISKEKFPQITVSVLPADSHNSIENLEKKEESTTTYEEGEEVNEKVPEVLGPSLPPHLQKVKDETYDEEKHPERVIGPTLPPHLRQQLADASPCSAQQDSDEDDSYGPLPVGAALSKIQLELEERAWQLKIDQLNPQGDDEAKREEWMLELPEVKAQNLGLGPRTFRMKGRPDLSDRSSWTDTPQDKAKKKKSNCKPEVDLRKEAETIALQKRDREQEAIMKKSKKLNDSLVDIHRKKLKDKKNDELTSIERRPFSRDVDLQVNRFDEAQKKAVLKKAQLLDDRFSSGQSKFL